MKRKVLLLTVILGTLAGWTLWAQFAPGSNYQEFGAWSVGGTLAILSGGSQTVNSGGTLTVASGATLAVNGTQTTSVGVGAKNGAAVTVVEHGNNVVHKTVFTLTALAITTTDATTAGAHGSHKLYDFPAGVIVRGGCVADATTAAGAGGIADGAAVVLSLGSVTTATDNAALTTTEADFIASYAGTLTSGAGVFTKYGEPSVTSLDGHTTPIDLYLNVAVPDADSSANDTLTISGTVTCIWSSPGDF